MTALQCGAPLRTLRYTVLFGIIGADVRRLADYDVPECSIRGYEAIRLTEDDVLQHELPVVNSPDAAVSASLLHLLAAVPPACDEEP